MVDRERYLYHLTLTTGHARKSYRSEISDEALAVCAELIERINARPLAPIEMPGPPGYVIVGEMAGPCGVAQVFTTHGEQPLITIGIATRERCGITPWQLLGGKGEQPRAPWLAVKIEPGIANDPAMHWLGDFERCLGWAFIESQEPRRGAGPR